MTLPIETSLHVCHQAGECPLQVQGHHTHLHLSYTNADDINLLLIHSCNFFFRNLAFYYKSLIVEKIEMRFGSEIGSGDFSIPFNSIQFNLNAPYNLKNHSALLRFKLMQINASCLFNWRLSLSTEKLCHCLFSCCSLLVRPLVNTKPLVWWMAQKRRLLFCGAFLQQCPVEGEPCAPSASRSTLFQLFC